MQRSESLNLCVFYPCGLQSVPCSRWALRSPNLIESKAVISSQALSQELAIYAADCGVASVLSRTPALSSSSLLRPSGCQSRFMVSYVGLGREGSPEEKFPKVISACSSVARGGWSPPVLPRTQCLALLPQMTWHDLPRLAHGHLVFLHQGIGTDGRGGHSPHLFFFKSPTSLWIRVILRFQPPRVCWRCSLSMF